ncbi:MAG TPA: hypothetical protein VM935_03115, partial [Chitinophagaceae bacterium]|nr:hypothetical protein [Chitinophagaceae bacterium]
MHLPKALIDSLKKVQGFDAEAFEEAHASGEQVTSIRINPHKFPPPESGRTTASEYPAVSREAPVPWSSFGFYLDKRPSFTFDPLFHAGCYYVQDASSMFLEHAMKGSVDLSSPLKVLDLCAAPGGKSTHLQSILSPGSLLVSNEVIKNRAGILKQNIYKWGCDNVIVTSNDPSHFKKLAGFFDVVVVDAPCSGSGLFRKDKDAINEWSLDNVQLCSGRQKRILSDALESLKEGGVLIYATCSYSEEEDEDIGDWLVHTWGMENIKLPIEKEWGIVETESQTAKAYGYRFFPDKVKGEGFYMAVFRKGSSVNFIKYKAARLEKASLKESAIVAAWLQDKQVSLLKEYFIYALPNALVQDYAFIKEALNVQYAGVALGEIMKEKLVPEHALALSLLVSPGIAISELSYEEAILYLQRADLKLNPVGKGWQLVSFNGCNLGWINALQNRINNYYPK